MAKDLRPVYTAINADMAAVRLDEFVDAWGAQYPAIAGLWRSAWTEFIPFLDYGACRRLRVSTRSGGGRLGGLAYGEGVPSCAA